MGLLHLDEALHLVRIAGHDGSVAASDSVTRTYRSILGSSPTVRMRPRLKNSIRLAHGLVELVGPAGEGGEGVGRGVEGAGCGEEFAGFEVFYGG